MALFVNPVGDAPALATKLVPTLDSLQGKTVGFRIQWHSFQLFMDRFRDMLEDRYHPKAIVTLNKDFSSSNLGEGLRNDKQLDEWAEQVDCAILGLAA